MSKRRPAVFLFAVAFAALSALVALSQQPTLTPQSSNTTALLIAVSPVDENVVWAVGTNSAFVVTADGGNTWRSGVVPTPNSADVQLRDVQGVSAQVAYVLSIGNLPADFAISRPPMAATLGLSSSRINSSALSMIALLFGLPQTGLRIAIR